MEDLLDLMFTEVNGLPEPNLEVRNIASIRAIIERDKGRPDEDGHIVRKRARMELAYVYFMAKRDLFSGYTSEQKHIKVRQRVGLPEYWEPDAIVKEALSDVEEDIITKQDKLLEATDELAEDFLTLNKTIRDNNRRQIAFFERDIADLTGEERIRRSEEIEIARAQLEKFAVSHKNLSILIEQLDNLRKARIIMKKQAKKKVLSSLETQKGRYERRADVD